LPYGRWYAPRPYAGHDVAQAFARNWGRSLHRDQRLDTSHDSYACCQRSHGGNRLLTGVGETALAPMTRDSRDGVALHGHGHLAAFRTYYTGDDARRGAHATRTDMRSAGVWKTAESTFSMTISPGVSRRL